MSLPRQTYDPQKAHEYYERTKKLKGREKGSGEKGSSTGKHPSTITTPHIRPSPHSAKIGRLEAKVSALSLSLSEARQALSKKRDAQRQTKKQNSDGKTSVKERAASQKYRDTHKAKIASKRTDKKANPRDVSSMDIPTLEKRIRNIRRLLGEAKRQLSVVRGLQHMDLVDTDFEISGLALLHSTSRKDAAVETADFSGVATAYGLRCTDGRTILPGAFDQNDGIIVPLVWQHGHDEPGNVLGHAKLIATPTGTRCEGFFNETPNGQNAKEMVRHGDLKFLSVWANQLVERVTDATTRAKDVIKGNIREVSLVMAGANPGAFIDNVAIAHGEGDFDDLSDEAYITSGIEIEVGGVLTHADDETVQDVLDTLSEKQLNAVNYLLGQALIAGSDSIEHSDTEGDDAESVDGDGPEPIVHEPVDAPVVSEGSDESSDSEDAEDADTNDGSDETDESDESADSDGSEGSEESEDSDADAGDAVQHNDNQEDKGMEHNVFDQSGGGPKTPHLSHADVKSIFEDTVKIGSLKRAVENFVMEHGVTVDGTLQHGIENIDYLFPDARLTDDSPQFVARRMEWVNNVLGSVRKSPFSRIKTVTADITPDEARARGYVKGNLKNEEFFEMSKRETTPQTIYKKQKLDRDDVIDIVDLDVVAWLKAEMRVMLDEELAGAILCGDGRSAGDDDKIIETKIRPVATDSELYVTTVNVNLLDGSSTIEELVDAAIANRRWYKGSGTPTFYTTEATIGAFLTVKDNFGRRLYNTLGDIAAVLRVKEVVAVEIMERDATLLGIMVNLSDYTVGADKGGAVSMFDDFDLDYNKLLYLIETRVSGALTQPKSALVFRGHASTDVRLANPTAPSFDEETNVVTVPTVTHVSYHLDTPGGATLTTGAPTTLTDGQEYHVVAVAAAGYYFDNNAQDEFDFVGGDIS